VWVPKGSPDKFSDVPTDSLLEHLANSKRSFGEGDDAEAFAETIQGKQRLLEALSGASFDDGATEAGWKFLLSYSHAKSDNPETDRNLIERVARLALQLPTSFFAGIAGQLSYWIDASDEKVPAFEGSDRLWGKLLPYAVAEANSKSMAVRDGEGTVDLTSAALNEPLGHLLSLFSRRLPSLKRGEELPSLPTEMIEQLKKLEGRARELLANRMAIQMNYFALEHDEISFDSLSF
jgi:hypothetical protein